MRGRKSWAWGAGLMALAGLGMTLSVWAAEDDLAVVKRAVAVQTADVDELEAPAAPAAPAVRKSSSRRPTWLKVRIVEEKDGKKEDRVSVTLPLALFSVLGKDATVDLSQLGVHGLKDHAKNVRIMDVIETLEPGSMLVEIQDDHAHVRVWVE